MFCLLFFGAINSNQSHLVRAADLTFSTIIDPDEYIIGPGDQFRIDFWDGSTSPLDPIVTPEGRVLLPSMGVVEVGALTLTEAKLELRTLVNKFYSEAQFSVSLVGVRPVKILITGGVVNPGLYNAFASQRVSEIIQMAGGFDVGASRRNIILARDGTDRVVDILRFEQTGDMTANPYLYSGYKIHVPLVTDSSTFVQISGEVVNPGGLEYKEGDSLGSIIDLALGMTGWQGDSILVFRKDTSSYRKISVSITKMGLPIQPGDKIIVVRTSREKIPDYYSVTGEVFMPGRYPQQGHLSLEMALNLAGGITPRADIFSLTIYRKPEFMRSIETVKTLEALGRNNVSFSAEREPTSLDMKRFYPDRLDEITIYPSDSILVPALTGSVGIYGRVNRPGMLEFSGMNSAGDLIKSAGGYAAGADKKIVQIVRKSSGLAIMAGPDIDVFDGDTVIIPEDENPKSFWDKLKDLTLILGGAGLVYLAVDHIAE